MELIAKFLLKLIIDRVNNDQEAPFSRFMLKPRGPGTDVGSMIRSESVETKPGTGVAIDW